jgi:hypothetical protein
MKLTWFTLPVFLAAGIACANGSSLSAEIDSISSRSTIEATIESLKGSAARTLLLAAGVSSFSRIAPTPLLRSMWGE